MSLSIVYIVLLSKERELSSNLNEIERELQAAYGLERKEGYSSQPTSNDSLGVVSGNSIGVDIGATSDASFTLGVRSLDKEGVKIDERCSSFSCSWS